MSRHPTTMLVLYPPPPPFSPRETKSPSPPIHTYPHLPIIDQGESIISHTSHCDCWTFQIGEYYKLLPRYPAHPVSTLSSPGPPKGSSLAVTSLLAWLFLGFPSALFTQTRDSSTSLIIPYRHHLLGLPLLHTPSSPPPLVSEHLHPTTTSFHALDPRCQLRSFTPL